MKRFKVISVALLLILIVTACGTSTVQSAKEERFTAWDHGLDITEDKETGCKYVIYNYGKRDGITPLLNSNGGQTVKVSK